MNLIKSKVIKPFEESNIYLKIETIAVKEIYLA